MEKYMNFKLSLLILCTFLIQTVFARGISDNNKLKLKSQQKSKFVGHSKIKQKRVNAFKNKSSLLAKIKARKLEKAKKKAE